jgi:cytochrome P450
MLTDLISRSFFSIQVDDRTNKDNLFAQIVADTLVPVTPSISQEITIYSHAFPFLKYIFKEPLLKPEAVEKFVKLFKHMMEERRRSGQNRNDLVDMCLDWWDKLESPEFNKVKISELTLLMQALIFFVAAQDQLSTMVASVIYHMTKDPELERKIYEEVDGSFAKNNGKIGHEQLSQLTILNACIQECLRLYPVFHRTERMCTKDWVNEEYNLSLKKGTTVVIPIYALNRNGEYHDNPDDFNYERFMPENKDKLNPFAFTSFGHGPRNCTGKRFALEAMPLILAYMLKELKFVGREDTQIKLLAGGMLNTAHGTIYVDVVERK